MKLPNLFNREVGAERYGTPMILLLFSMVVIMSAGKGPGAAAASLTLQGLALIATFSAAEARPWIRRPGSALIAVMILIAWFQAIFLKEVESSVIPIGAVILVVVATPVIILGLVRQANRDGGITIHTLFGSICIYLLLALGFASAFVVIGLKGGTPFFTQGPEWDTLRNCLYYSLTTITTLGIGDLSPATDLGRSLTASEALIGQIYIVTVVALVVGNVKPRRAPDED